jgi:hypothetical protein
MAHTSAYPPAGFGDHGDGDLAQIVDARLNELLAAATGPVNWRTLAPDDAAAAWVALRDWVDWFRIEYGYDHRIVPPCWYRHPAMVSLLSALRDHWTCAYDPLNTPTGASEWHRVLQQLEPRLREWAARTGCSTGSHRPDLHPDYPDDADDWQQHVAADIAARTAHADRQMRAAIATAQASFATATQHVAVDANNPSTTTNDTHETDTRESEDEHDLPR